ncbi:PAS domain S-box protein, partial [Leptolyngbya sp. FACHB-36]|uniref:PAS domain-containing protein n=1 Tax=Leptolyngbya sp. FACHB-36 TaxID=2692808 RepID=UPI0016814FA0
MSSADSNPPVELPRVDVPFSPEEALRRSEERYRSLIRASAQIIWNTTAEGELTTEQPGWRAFTGQSFEEYKGWGWLNAVHPDDQAVTAEAWTKALANCTLYEMEHRLRRHDGEYRYMQVRAVSIVEADGSVREWTGSHTDITDRKQAEAAIRESEERFRTLADNAPMLLWMSDTDAQYEFFNQGWLSFTGRTLEQELGNGWADGVHPNDLQRCLDLHLGAFQTQQPFEVEYRLRRADGEYRWILDRGAPRVLPNGTFAGFIGSCIDITARKRAEDSLHHRAEELSRTSMRLALTAARLEKRNQELDQFAYVVSHDL